MTDRELAEKIAADLFTNGNGDKGDRLVMVQEPQEAPRRDLGGWCQAAVVNRVENILKQKSRPVDRAAASQRTAARQGRVRRGTE